MKKIWILAIMLCGSLLVSCGEKDETAIGNLKPKEERIIPNWKEAANSTAEALIKYFWGDAVGQSGRYCFNSNSAEKKFEYWPQAHAMDVIVDAYERTKENYYLDFYEKWYQGMPTFNRGGSDGWKNNYIDDMEWIALTLIRMYETSGNEKYFIQARHMFDDYIWITWGPDNEEPWCGGITWCTSSEKSKNACSNGPAAIIAAKLYKYYDVVSNKGTKNKETYLQEAKDIFNWEKKALFNQNTGMIADRMEKGGVAGGALSYNQGTFLGAGLFIYQLTNDKSYLDAAIKAATYGIENIGQATGAKKKMTNPGTGDGGLFHGIFFRYLALLTNEQAIPANTKKYFKEYMEDCGICAQKCLVGGCNLCSTNWETEQISSTTEKRYLNPHVSGSTLLAALCTLK